MARLHQVAGRGVARHGGLHGARAVGGGDAGGDAARGLDGDGEGGAVLRAVARRHGLQAQAFAAFAREREADEPAAMLGHEVDGLCTHMVGREDEVAFVFTVFLVHEDHHAARGQLGDQCGNGGQRHAAIVGGASGASVAATGAPRHRCVGVGVSVAVGEDVGAKATPARAWAPGAARRRQAAAGGASMRST